jgi:hypothetical protein
MAQCTKQPPKQAPDTGTGTGICQRKIQAYATDTPAPDTGICQQEASDICLRVTARKASVSHLEQREDLLFLRQRRHHKRLALRRRKLRAQMACYSMHASQALLDAHQACKRIQ